MTKKSKHASRPQPARQQGPDQPRGKAREADFWHARTAQELAAEQGVQLLQDVDRLIGQGAECWDSDADFERWMEWLREIRREGH